MFLWIKAYKTIHRDCSQSLALDTQKLLSLSLSLSLSINK
jgi:hypothetical protein